MSGKRRKHNQWKMDRLQVEAFKDGWKQRYSRSSWYQLWQTCCVVFIPSQDKTKRLYFTENCSLCLHQTFSWKSHISFFPASSKCPNPQNRRNLQEPGDLEAASAAASFFQLKLCLSWRQKNDEIPHFWAGWWKRTEKEIACTTRGGRLLPVSLLILG